MKNVSDWLIALLIQCYLYGKRLYVINFYDVINYALHIHIRFKPTKTHVENSPSNPVFLGGGGGGGGGGPGVN